MRKIVKQLAFSTGLYQAYHRLTNINTLTVPMFHRVLPRTDARWDYADPDWTVDTGYFRSCLKFFKKYYRVISLDDLENDLLSKNTSPRPALLVTFDDGWRDHLEYALPILEEEQVPALFFVTSRAIDRKHLAWQEILHTAWKKNELNTHLIPRLKPHLTSPPGEAYVSRESLEELAKKITQLERAARKNVYEIIAAYSDTLPSRLMLSSDELARLSRPGYEIGSHGAIHQPMPLVDNPANDIKESIASLEKITNVKIRSFSFPHSQYNQNILESITETGLQYIFAGHGKINRMTGLDHQADDKLLFSRIGIDQTYICTAKSGFSEPEMANYLFRLGMRTPDRI